VDSVIVALLKTGLTYNDGDRGRGGGLIAPKLSKLN